MSCNCDCCKGMKICPVSFGLALGITAALVLIVCNAWMMYMGDPASAMMHNMVVMSWADALTHSLYFLVKGFLFGFVLAGIYDLIVCCMSKMCSKKSCK